MKYIAYTTANPPGLLQKIFAIIVTAALITLGLMFSAVLLVGILIVGVIAGAYFWWKTREVRKQMRQMQEAMQDFQARSTAAGNAQFEGEVFEGEIIEGEIIEGEVIRVDEAENETRR